MKRKGWKPDEDDMNLVVAIHNAVNEQAWVEVVKMEQSLYPECSPKLISIQGKWCSSIVGDNQSAIDD